VVKEDRATEQGNGQQQLLEEIAGLKKLVAEMNRKEQPQQQAVLYPGILKEIHQQLCNQEIGEPIQQELMNKLVEKWYIAKKKPSYAEALHWLKMLMIDRLSHLPFGKATYDKKYINVVGPTGVGKT